MIRSAYKGLHNAVQKITTVAGKNYTTAQVGPLQKAALEERCILVDNSDKAIGEATKRACHVVNPEGVILHRAFSVFMFNSRKELLLQKRSDNKVTFPGYYGNTCCSHPLAEIPDETVEKDALGVRRAAVRRLCYELGIPKSEIKPDDLLFMTKIHYHAINNKTWGEHEIDYILIMQKDVTVNPNPEEVSEVTWVSRTGLADFVKNLKAPLSPWFQLVMEHKLYEWWDNLDALDKVRNVDKIYHYRDMNMM